MIYTKRDKLTRYCMPDDSDEVCFGDLRAILMERPSNVVYCEKSGKLYGIISMGDIDRADNAGKDFVTVNRRFTKIKPNEYMRAKQIFKDNENINALPVVSDSNEFMGDYSRWDELIACKNAGLFQSDKYAMDFWRKNRKIALVRPCKEFRKKQELMQAWKEKLLQARVQVSVINREDVMDAFDCADYILFTDEDEKRGTGTLYQNILGRRFDWSRAKTYAQMKDVIADEMWNRIGEEVLKSAMSSGIHVVTLNYEDNKSEYCKILETKIDEKFSEIGKKRECVIHDAFKEGFFAELYSEEYVKKILSHSYSVTHADGISKLKDADEETYKVTDGERRTLAQPSAFQRCIYFFGPCIAIGFYVADEHTIESFLQARLNDKGYQVKCVNYGFFAGNDQLAQLIRLVSTKFHKGDIVILHNQNRKYEGVLNLNLTDVCEKYNVSAAWMVNEVIHGNHKLNRIYADEIFRTIEPIVQKDVEKKEPVEMRYDFITLGYLERYFYDTMIMPGGGITGAIVMNCNPFTLGHRYLIEQALNQVEHLIIFVVEEDQSIFTFKERFAMVVEGTKDLEGVTVVPSGSFILSQTTFPEYFIKLADEDIIQNVEYDITLFAEQIAPKLNITYRFVGEEPQDNVTNEYNEAMKRILPKYGINIVEIPRIKTEGNIISASFVREKLLRGEMEEIDRFIPATTKEILNICWE